MSYVRVKDNETGHHVSVPQSFYDSHKDSLTVLKQDAQYPDGSPVETKYKTSVAEAASVNSGQQAEKKES